MVQRDGGEPLFASALQRLRPATWWTCRCTGGTCRRTWRPAHRLLDAVAERQVDAVTFTSSYAVHNAFEIAADQARVVDAFDA